MAAVVREPTMLNPQMLPNLFQGCPENLAVCQIFCVRNTDVEIHASYSFLSLTGDVCMIATLLICCWILSTELN